MTRAIASRSAALRRAATQTACTLVVGAVAAGCVSAHAGYQDVRQLTSARLGAELSRDVDNRTASDSSLSSEVRKLLQNPLTAERAARVALLNSPALSAELQRVGVARADLLSATRLPNPHVGAALLYGHGEQPEVEVDAMLNLTSLLFLPSRRGAAVTALDAAAMEVAAAAIDVAYDARRQFYDYQAALARLDLTETVLQAYRAAADMAERMYEAGNITELRLESERALYEEARIRHTRAEAAALAAREPLNARLGLWGEAGTQWSAFSRLPDPLAVEGLLASLESASIQQSLPLQAAQRRAEAAATRANLARAGGWLPELNAGVAAERAEDTWAWGPAAEVSVPLFYQGQGESAAALSEMYQWQATAEQLAMQVRARARQTALQLQATTRMVEHYRSTILPLRERVLEQAQLQFNAMSLGVFELLQAKRDQVAAAETYLDLLQDYWRLRSDAEQLRAGGLPAEGAIPNPRTAGPTSSAGDAH